MFILIIMLNFLSKTKYFDIQKNYKINFKLVFRVFGMGLFHFRYTFFEPTNYCECSNYYLKIDCRHFHFMSYLKWIIFIPS